MSLGTASVGVSDYVCGCFAGGSNVLTGYPLDTVKVHLQQSSKHTNAFSCARSLYRSGGVCFSVRKCYKY